VSGSPGQQILATESFELTCSSFYSAALMLLSPRIKEEDIYQSLVEDFSKHVKILMQRLQMLGIRGC
jgi:hypothetical protein